MRSSSLSNPSPVDREVKLIRPLLDFTKAELLEIAAANRIEFREDASNLDRAHDRNRIRHDLLPLIERSNVELLEQPLQPGRIENMATLAAATEIPVIADEDCIVYDDIDRLVGLVDGVNLKQVKIGGLGPALRGFRKAESLGLRRMFGSMVETKLGTAGAAAVAGAAAAGFFHAKLAQQDARRAKAGDARLEQVKAHKRREGEEPRAHKYRRALKAQRQRQHDKKASHDADVTFNGHFISPKKSVGDRAEDLAQGLQSVS